MSRCRYALLALCLSEVRVEDQLEVDGPGEFGEPCTGSGYVDFSWLGRSYRLAFEEWGEVVVFHLFWPGGQWHSHTYNDNNLPVSTLVACPIGGF